MDDVLLKAVWMTGLCLVRLVSTLIDREFRFGKMKVSTAAFFVNAPKNVCFVCLLS